MKKCLLFLFSIVCFLGVKAQTPVIINQPYDFRSWINVKGALQFPTGCGTPSGTASLNGGDRKKAALFQDSCAKKTYVYNPSDSSWSELGAGGGGSATILNNAGGGYRLVILPNGTIKTIVPGDGQKIDSAANILTISRDTTGANGTVTRSGLRDTAASIRSSTINLSTRATGLLPVANGGTGTATPGLIAGTNITSITGTWPNQTINAASGGGSADSGVFSTNYRRDTAISNIRNSNWPAEEPYGIIYSKNSWVGLNDFAINTLDGSTAQMTLSGNYINYSVTSIDWDNYTSILPIRPTILPNWSITVDFKMITAPSSTTVGFGLGTKKIIGGNGDVLCYINTTNGGSSGALSINRGDGTNFNSGTSFTVNQLDLIRLNVTFDDSVIVFTAINLTTGGSGSVSYTNTIGSSAAPISLLSNWALIGHSSTACTWQIQNISITSKTKRNANLVAIGDSKTQGFLAQYFATRYGTRLGNTYPSSIVYASGNAKISDFINSMKDEFTSLNGVQYLFQIGSNDRRGGATFQQMKDGYTQLVKWAQGGGARVLHIVLPEDSTHGGVGMSDFKQWVANTYPNDYINVWDQLSTNNILKDGYQGDRVHPNEAANKSIDSLIVLSGKIHASPVRGLRYRVSDNFLKESGDSIYSPILERALYRVLHWDNNGSGRTGVLFDDGDAAGVAKANGLPYVKVGAALFTVTGALAVNGPASGVLFSNRTGDQTVADFAIHSENGSLNIYDVTNNNGHMYIDHSLRTLFYNNVVSTSITIPSATLHVLGNTLGTAGHAPIKIGLSVPTSTPEPYAIEPTGLHWLVTDSLASRDTLATRGWVKSKLTPGYSVYTALISQAGTSDPTALVLGTNTIGSIVWTRSGSGIYVGTLTGAFTANKTWMVVSTTDQLGVPNTVRLTRTSANALLLTTWDSSSLPTDVFTNISIEIRVYP